MASLNVTDITNVSYATADVCATVAKRSYLSTKRISLNTPQALLS